MTVRIGLLGAGFLTRTTLLPTLRELAGFEVAVVGDPDPAALAAIRAQAPEVRVVPAGPDLDAFLAVPMDAVHVATPNGQHAAAVRDALAAAVAVLVDKPMAGTVADAIEIDRLARQAPLPVLVGYMARYNAANLAVQRLVADGAIGSVRTMLATHLGHRLVNWRNRRAESGLGSLADLAIYPLVTAGDLFPDPPDACRATAFPAGDPELTDIHAEATVWFGPGRLQLESSFTEAPDVGVSRYTLIGTEGVLVVTGSWAMDGGGCVLLCDRGGRRQLPLPAVNPYAEQYRLLRDCLAGREVPDAVSARRGLRDVAVLHRIDASAARGGERLTIPGTEPPWTS